MRRFVQIALEAMLITLAVATAIALLADDGFTSFYLHMGAHPAWSPQIDWRWLRVYQADVSSGPRLAIKVKGRVLESILLVTTVVALVINYRSLRSCVEPPGACPVCGYDLRASPLRCPECGAPAVKHQGGRHRE
jgi:hypothetical protein